ncbi:MAG: NAD(P)-dependent oxidoreductase [Cyanobacteria bacterium SID2]|nr:NAD(P)-dependent oxidoreductase [Cyanobacteria bacterium SID2]MBP0006669.1 NAD(P)-dependent oxidoreductase [Cyanobacteria bacterium SBC]
MKTLLVTGASGFLGWNLCQIARSNWRVWGTHHIHTLDIEGVNMLSVDLANEEAVKEAFDIVRPDAVIHTAAVSSPNFCQTHPELSYTVNVTASVGLAQHCRDRSIPFVFTSSEQVFDGKHSPYTEDDPVSPLNLYGEHKALAEREILQQYPNATIARMPLMFGCVPPTASSFIQPFLKAMREGRELKLFVDEFRTPVSGGTAARGLLLALEKTTGILHLGGRERISRYEFGRLMKDVFNLSQANLQSCRQADVPMSAPRPADVALDSSKAFAMGYSPPSLRKALEQIRAKV